MTSTEIVLRLVELELKRSEKHGLMHSPHEGKSVIEEELDELWEHVRADTGKTTAAVHEAIQIAAMGVKYVLSFGTDFQCEELRRLMEMKRI